MEATDSRSRSPFRQRRKDKSNPGIPQASQGPESRKSHNRAESAAMQADFRQESSSLRLGFSSRHLIFYTLLLLKTALSIILVWISSDLHLGLPCFLLVLTYWLYKGPLQRALDWAKRCLWGREEAAPGPSSMN